MSSPTAAGAGTFPTFISVSLVDLLATVTLLVVIIGVAWRLVLWRNLLPGRFFGRARSVLGTSALVRIFLLELWNRVLLQKDIFYNTDRNRRLAHLAMFWGFVGLAATTTLEFLFNRDGSYVPLFGTALSPIRWLGNISGVVMVAGATITIAKFVSVPEFRRGRHFGDAWFGSLLFLAGVTGFIAEYFGEQAYIANPNIPPAAAFSLSLSSSPLIMIPYGIHLVSIGLLLITAPASMFIHALTAPSRQYLDRVGVLLTRESQEDKLKLLDSIERKQEARPS